jgi:hypothetical protein
MIPWIFLWAEGASVDPGVGSIVQLVGGLGASAAAVLVVWIFVGYMKSTAGQNSEALNNLAEAVREMKAMVSNACRYQGPRNQ